MCWLKYKCLSGVMLLYKTNVDNSAIVGSYFSIKAGIQPRISQTKVFRGFIMEEYLGTLAQQCWKKNDDIRLTLTYFMERSYFFYIDSCRQNIKHILVRN